jgi:hypothetical protein
MAKKEAPLQTFFVCSLRTVAWQLLLSVYAVLQGHPQRQPEQHSVQAAGCRHYGGAAAAAGSSLRSTHVRRGSAGATDKNGFLLLLAFPLFVQSLSWQTIVFHRYESSTRVSIRFLQWAHGQYQQLESDAASGGAAAAGAAAAVVVERAGATFCETQQQQQQRHEHAVSELSS